MRPLSPTARLVQALRLVELPLVDPTVPRSPRAAIAPYLQRTFGFDQELCLRAVDTAFACPLRTQVDLRQSLRGLAAVSCALVTGRPQMRADPDAYELLRLVDPEVMLVAAAHPSGDDDFGWSSVPVGGLQESFGVLERESVDTHVHLGGVLPSAWFWSVLVGGSVPLSLLHGMPGAPQGVTKGFPWVDAVAQALVDRLELADAIRACSRSSPWPHVAAALTPPDDVVGSRGTVIPLALGTHLARLLRHGPFPSIPAMDLLGRDPLRWGWNGTTQVHPMAAERRFLHLALTAPDLDERSVGRLMRYLRVRNAFHQALVHLPGPEGLHRFSEAFRRRGLLAAMPPGPHRKQPRAERYLLELESMRVASALQTTLVEPFPSDRYCKSSPPRRRVELRVSIPRGPLLPRTVAAWLHGVGRFAAALDELPGEVPPRIQVGFVVHALRRGTPEQMTVTAGETFRGLLSFLSWRPELRRFVVGVDVAGAERRAPPRSFAAAYDLVARVQRTFVARVDEPPIALGMTLHAGEDFRDLLTAIRHVDEAARVVTPRLERAFTAGSRVGHGLALGVDAKSFYHRRHHRVEVPLTTHLLDLCWLWNLCRAKSEAAPKTALEHRVASLLREHHRAGSATVHDLLERGAKLLPVPDVKAPLHARAPLGTEAELAAAWVPWAQGLDVRVDLAEPWYDLVRLAQECVRALLASLGTCVEVNPSSNLLVSAARTLGDLGYDALVDAHVPVSVNTDDPGMFVTSLPREVALLRADRESRGFLPKDIARWLADRVADGCATTFLRAATPEGTHLLAPLATRGGLARVMRMCEPRRPFWATLDDAFAVDPPTPAP